ncbi:MAG: hypothetical protein V1244_01250 [Nitrospinaceae bacterium]|nr:hypothetical protein [Nitrospinaceae bacterium]
MDALDALLCLGYAIVKEMPESGTLINGPRFRLCSAATEPRHSHSVSLLLGEVDDARMYYSRRLIEEGKKLP